MIFTSPLPDVLIPEISFTDFLFERFRRYGSKPALIDYHSGDVLTYADLLAQVEAVAGGLHAHGLRKGDVFALYCPNSLEFVVLMLAVLRLGGIVTTANPLYTAHELALQLLDCQASYMYTTLDYTHKARIAHMEYPLKTIFVDGEAAGTQPYGTLLQGAGNLPQVPIDARTDIAVLPYSSGTTGLPKGVMLTHYNLVANICQLAGGADFSGEDVALGVLPFFHIYGMIMVLSYQLYLGATVVVMRRFDLLNLLEAIQTYAVSRICVVPPMLLALEQSARIVDYDLSSLRQINCGAAPLQAEGQRRVGQTLNCLLIQSYGLTEASPVTHVTPLNPLDLQPGSVGVLLPNTQMQIADVHSGETVGYGQAGEVWIRGPQVMQGYLHNPEATRATVDAEGWLHTGDFGYVDEAGHLYIVDRLKELIKYKGFSVAPAVLEGVLLTHEAVADAAVVGVPDEVAGEVPKAFVVAKPGTQPDANALMAYVAQQVAPHEKIRQVEFVLVIPKSASGKILRRQLIHPMPLTVQ